MSQSRNTMNRISYGLLLLIVYLICTAIPTFGQSQGSALSAEQGHKEIRETIRKVREEQEKMIYKLAGRKVSRQQIDELKMRGALKLVDSRFNIFGKLVAYYESIKSPVGQSMADFDVTDGAGNSYSLKSLDGKVVVINFWFLGCKWCLVEMPELNEIVETYKGKPVEFLAFGREQVSIVEKVLNRKGMRFDYKLINPSKEVNALAEKYVQSGWPGHIILGPNGTIEYLWSGYNSEEIGTKEMLTEGINQTLKKYKLD